MIKKYPLIFASLTYLTFAFFSIRDFLSKSGTIGHNWDSYMPALPYYYKHIISRVFYTWSIDALGISKTTALPTSIWWFYNAVQMFLFGKYVTHFIIISTILISGISMFCLVRYILIYDLHFHWDNNKLFFSCLLSGFFFAFSPFMYCQFIGGAGNQYQTNMTLPLAILFFKKAHQKQYYKYLFFTALVISWENISLQSFIFTTLILLAYALIQENLKRHILSFVKIYILVFFINVYWIIPMSYSIMWEPVSSKLSEALTLGNIIYNVPTIYDILIAVGYIRPFYDHSLHGTIKPIWYLISYMTVIFVIFIPILFHSVRKEALFWLALLLISIVFATGANPPFGNFVQWCYQNTNLFTIFRSPQWFIIVPTLCFSVLLGIGTQSMLNKYHSIENTALKWAIFLCVAFWVHPSYSSGDFGIRKLYNYSKRTGNWYIGDHLDYYKIPPSYKAIYDLFEKEKENFRVLVLPMTASPYFLKTKYQLEGGGIDPLIVEYPAHPFVTNDTYNLPTDFLRSTVGLLEESIYLNKNIHLSELLIKSFGVKYIMLRKDVLPNDSKFRTSWNWRAAKRYLMNFDSFDLIAQYEYVDLYIAKEYLPAVSGCNYASMQ